MLGFPHGFHDFLQVTVFLHVTVDTGPQGMHQGAAALGVGQGEDPDPPHGLEPHDGLHGKPIGHEIEDDHIRSEIPHEIEQLLFIHGMADYLVQAMRLQGGVETTGDQLMAVGDEDARHFLIQTQSR